MREGKQVNDKRVTAKKERLNIGAKYIFLKNSIKNPAPKRAGFKY